MATITLTEEELAGLLESAVTEALDEVFPLLEELEKRKLRDKSYQAAYYRRNAEDIKAYSREYGRKYRAARSEEILEKERNRYQQSPAKKESNRRYQQTQGAKEKRKAYEAANRDRINAQQRARRARQKALAQQAETC